MTPEDFIASISPKVQNIGALHYFHPAAKQAAESLGIDGFRFYFLGRAGVLGDVEAEVVQASFGYFEPGLLAKMWTTGKERANFADTAAAQLNVAYQIGAEQLGDVDGLAEAADAMGQMAAAVDPAGLPLFAGFMTKEVPEDPAAAFMHQSIIHRELRGSVHLAGSAALGLPSRVAHQLKRPNDQESFGYASAMEVTDAQRATHSQLEAMTNAAMLNHAEAISSEQRAQVADTVDATAAVLAS